jgi:hypothetical protein
LGLRLGLGLASHRRGWCRPAARRRPAKRANRTPRPPAEPPGYSLVTVRVRARAKVRVGVELGLGWS